MSLSSNNLGVSTSVVNHFSFLFERKNVGPQEEPPGAQPNPTHESIRRIKSESLLAGSTQVKIEYLDQTYRLIQTKRGKLVLKK